MFNIDFTFLWTAVNLLIIYLIVNKFLFKKLGVFMENRSAAIASDISKAEAMRKEAEAFISQQDKLLREASDKQREILETAKLKAIKEHDSIISDAKKEAARIIQAARDTSEREREELYKALRKDVASLAISAASKIIESNMDNEKNWELVKSFLAKEEAA